MESDASPQTVEDARILLKRTWLGDPTKTSEEAITAKKLGYDLFHTASAIPSFK